MEEIAIGIFRIVFIAILIVTFVRRNKQRRMTDDRADSDSMPPEAPQESFPRRHAAPAQPVRPVSETPAKRVVVQPAAEPLHSRRDVAQTADSHRQPQPHRPVQQPSQPADTQRIEPAVAASNTDPSHGSEQRDIIENFDIREAVLYSEILRPKFDEQV